jgi:DNA-binding PadR family transcriptional regulator
MAVREGLMALMASEPRYGYQLKTAFESATGGVWRLNIGQVYTTLDRLQRDGLVAVDAGEQKRYSLTPVGEEALGAWWQVVPSDEPPPRDELQLKVLLAIGHGPEHALAVITRQRTALTRLLQTHRRSHPAGDRAPLAEALVADALAVRAEADLRWLDLCEARILRTAHDGGTP